MDTKHQCGPCNGNCNQGRTCPAKVEGGGIVRGALMGAALWVLLMAVIAFTLAVLFPSKANAAEFGLHVGSMHAPRNGMNNANPGAYVITDAGWTLGAYYNSERRMSAYGGWTYTHRLPSDWRLQVAMGAVTGYESRSVLPLVAPSITTPAAAGWRARIAFLPKVEKAGANVLHLMVQREF